MINGGEIHKTMDVSKIFPHRSQADGLSPFPPSLRVIFLSHDDIYPTLIRPCCTLAQQTMLEIVDAMDAFGIVRTEPVLVVGGGLVTDVTGYACASYRRSSNFIRVPTTLIGLIDASVSIKVGINHRKLKNR